jgi:glycosyltransferase involved in cell wall biosynthesis
MGQCDFLVSASHGESFGLAVAEALCMGLPVVATRGTACEAFLGEGDGVLVEPRDADSLAEGVVRMIGRLDQFDREAIAERARRQFSGRSVAEWYGGLYRRLMETAS